MTIQQSSSGIGLMRCAVCKIDLKGRFVYVDEKVEDLLGYTKEDLFGKSLLDFIDEPSQKLIEQLLSHRNHYETFYDSTAITLLDQQRSPVTARAVVSLNFIAGNPVNYQLIIDQTDRSASQAPSDTGSHYKTILENLASIDSEPDWRQLLQAICNSVKSRQACVYMLAGEYLEPRSAVSGEDSGEHLFSAIGDPGDLHLDVAQTGKEYSFIDQDAVQGVIEKYGSAPDEFVSRVETPDGAQYLVRLIFPQDFDHRQAGSAIKAVKCALPVVARMVSSSSETTATSDPMRDIKFTIGFLDSLGISALLTNHEGAVIGYNPSALTIFDESQLESNYRHALKPLMEYNAPDVERQIVDHIATPDDREDHYADLAVEIKTSPSDCARLIVMKLGDTPDDLSSCLVFIPGIATTDCASTGAPDWKMWQAVLSSLSKSLKTVSFTADQVCHEFYNELGDKGNNCIEKIDSAMSNLLDVVRRLSGFVRQIKVHDAAQTVDLNLLINQQMQKILNAYPGSAVDCTYKSLPKIKTHQRLLGAALYNVLANCVVFGDKGKTNIKIKAEVSAERCTIDVADNGMGIASKHIPRLCDFFYRVPDKKVQSIPGLGLGLSLTKKLVESLKGDINVTSTEGEGTLVRISIPVQ